MKLRGNKQVKRGFTYLRYPGRDLLHSGVFLGASSIAAMDVR